MFRSSASTFLIKNLTLLSLAPIVRVSSLVGPGNRLPVETQENDVNIVESSFMSFALSEIPFVSSAPSSIITIVHSVFANMTATGPRDFRTACDKCCCLAIIHSCSFSEVDNVLDGEIVSSINGQSAMDAFNTSFSRCRKTGNDLKIEGNETMKKQDLGARNDTLQFIACEWHNTSSAFTNESFSDSNTEYSGGAIGIYGGDNCSAIVEDCLFDTCTCQRYGGAIMVYCGKSVQWKGNVFEKCKSHNYGGITLLFNIKKCTFIEDCVCRNTSAVAYCGGIRIQNCRSTGCEEDGPIVNRCYFDSCDVKISIGGGALLFYEMSYTMKTHECTFKNSTASFGGGGMIYIYDNASIIGENFILCVSSFSTRAEGNRVYHSALGEKNSWLPNGILERFVKKDGVDKEFCGIDEGSACQSIEYAVESFSDSGEQRLKLLESVFSPKSEVSRPLRDIVVRGVAQEQCVIKTENLPGQFLFEVSSGSLLGSNFSVEHSAAKQGMTLFAVSSVGKMKLNRMKLFASEDHRSVLPFTSPLIICSGDGTLNVDELQISGFFLSNCSVFNSLVGGIEMKNVLVENLQRLHGNGSVVSEVVGSGEMVDLSNVSLNNCSCQEGDGGGFCIRVKRGGSLRVGNWSKTALKQCSVADEETKKGKGGGMMICVEDGGEDIILGDVQFSGCSGWWGRNVFVEARELSRVVSSTSVLFGTTKMEDKDMMGMEDGCGEEAVPLLAYLAVFGGSGYVGGSGMRDFSGCGTKNYPCRTIGKVVHLRFGDGKRAIVMQEGFVWKEETVMGNEEWELKCVSERTAVRVECPETLSGEAVIVSQMKTSMTNIRFQLTPFRGSSEKVFVECQAGSMLLSYCEAEMAESGDELMNTFAKASGGLLKFVNFKMRNVVLGDISAIVGVESEAGTELVMENCLFDSVELDGGCAVSVSNVNVMNATKSNFTSITRATGDGGGMSVTVSGETELHSVLIEECVFNACSVNENGKGGGGMHLHIAKTNVVKVNKCSFCLCTATAAPGKGLWGGILIKVVDADANFVVSLPSFGEGGANSAEHGNDLFIESPNLTESVIEERFPFGKYMQLSEVDGMRGFDGADRLNAIPLVYLLHDVGVTISASSTNGLDVAGCGFVEYPCRTVGYSFQRQQEQEKDVEVVGVFELNESVSLSHEKGCFVHGKSEMSEVIVHGSASGETGLLHMKGNGQPNSCVKLLLFSVPRSVQEHEALFSQESKGTMRIENCSFRSQNEGATHTFCAIVANNGKTELVFVTVDNMCFSGSQLMRIEGAAAVDIANMKSLNATTSSEMGLVYVCGAEAQLNVKNSVFDNEGSGKECRIINSCGANGVILEECVLKSGIVRGRNGSAVCCVVGEEQILKIVGGNFESCESTGGNGGGIFVKVKAGGLAELGNTSSVQAIECSDCHARSVEDSGGRGGGMYLSVDDEVKAFCIQNAVFDGCSATRGGNWVFVEGKELKRIVNGTAIGFEFEKAVEIARLDDVGGCELSAVEQVIPLAVLFRGMPAVGYVGGNGIDYEVCGFKDFACKTIEHAGSVLFGKKNATLKLQSSFVFEKDIILDAQPMDICGEANSTLIKVKEDENWAGKGMIETQHDIRLHGMVFQLPRSEGDGREKWMMCCNSMSLKIEKCHFVNESGVVGMGIVAVSGGRMEMTHCRIEGCVFVKAGVILFDGNEAEGVLDGLYMRNVGVSEEGSVVRAKAGVNVEIANSEFRERNETDGNVIRVEGDISVGMRNSTFSGLKRGAGNGGAIDGKVGEAERVEIVNCTLEHNGCDTGGSRGGSVLVEVDDGGYFGFDENTVNRSTVPSGSGLGGGLYVNLWGTGSEYSMKKIVFDENGASKGKDVFVECIQPRLMIVGVHWNGSAQNNTAEDRLWVLDRLSEATEGVTMMEYLFPSSSRFVFVNGNGSNSTLCGYRELPCESVDLGFQLMNTTHSIIQLQATTPVSGQIDRDGDSLTIQGDESKPLLAIGGDAQFVLSSGEALTQLVFSDVNFDLSGVNGGGSAFDCVVEACAGQCSFVGDIFWSGGEEGNGACEKWIVVGKGSTVRFDDCEVRSVKFFGERGIIQARSGTVILTKTLITGCSGREGSGLVVVCVGSSCTADGCTVDNCWCTGDGGGWKIETGGRMKIANGSTISGCKSVEGRGGGGSCVVGLGGELITKGVHVERCSVDEGKWRGGGIFVQVEGADGKGMNLREVWFKENKGKEGKDLFLECVDLNNTATQASIAIDLFDENGVRIADMAGVDEVNFDESVDLMLFLVERRASVVVVDGGKGVDVNGCGSEAFPCKSIWSGVGHFDDSSERYLQIVNVGSIEDCYEFLEETSVVGVTGGEREKVILVIQGNPKRDGVFEAVLTARASLTIGKVSLELPSKLENELKVAIISKTGTLTLESCQIVCDAEMKFGVIEASGNGVELINCQMESSSFSVVPFLLLSRAVIEGCNFTGIRTEVGKKGGVAEIEVGREENVVVNRSRLMKCGCSIEDGKGGFAFLNTTNTEESPRFVFEGLVFDQNEAWLGRNVFIVDCDLNESVNQDAFRFNYGSGEGDTDGNMFVGSDSKFAETDLLRFLVSYKGWEVYVGKEGFDVARCGRQEEPCNSFWKGMEQLKSEGESRFMFVSGETVIRDEYDLEEFEMKSDGKRDESKKSRVVFEKKASVGELWFIRSHGGVLVEDICFEQTEAFEEHVKALIWNEGGLLNLSDCSFVSVAKDGSEFSCSLVFAKQGVLIVQLFRMESSNIGDSVFAVGDEATCVIEKATISGVNMNCDAIVKIVGEEHALGRFETNLVGSVELKDCILDDVQGRSDRCSVMRTDTGKEVMMKVNGSVASDCRAKQSLQGGVMELWINGGGRMNMVNSSVVRCSCSDTGKGGGVYVGSNETGVLDFEFRTMVFVANTAGVGCDIFVQCFSISSQINETQFRFDLRKISDQEKGICGIDSTEHKTDTNLLDFITVYLSDTIYICSERYGGGKNDRQCGAPLLPCATIDYALDHLTGEYVSEMYVVEQANLEGEAELNEMELSSRLRNPCVVNVCASINGTSDCIIQAINNVAISRVYFEYCSTSSDSHSSFLCVKSGLSTLGSCSFRSSSMISERVSVGYHIIRVVDGGCMLERCTVSELHLTVSAINGESDSISIISSVFGDVSFEEPVISLTSKVLVESKDEKRISLLQSVRVENVTQQSDQVPLEFSELIHQLELSNCSVSIAITKGNGSCAMDINKCTSASMDLCLFDGLRNKDGKEKDENTDLDGICKWNESLIRLSNSNVMMKVTSVVNSSIGGISVCGGSVEIEKGEFIENNPLISNYPSLRRNIICSDSGVLNVRSLKGGDGLERNTSLWILNEGCELSGIVSERASPLFIPVVEEARNETASEGRTIITLSGRLLLPCNVSLKLSFRNGREEVVESYGIGEKESVSENEIVAVVSSAQMGAVGAETEVSVSLLFGKIDSPSSTDSFILKNRSETQGKGDDRIVEGGKEGKSFWPIIVVVMAIILLIVLVVSVVVTIRWRKVKNEAEDLREIVNDNIRKDPKAFEMVTMEMSPEAQWRRAEREAEKKNDERIKKRVYENSLGHSESSEHLLSESGSTEYILGRDSDKIPQWMLEKVDEKEVEEETRKRTPSPSILSTSTTSTTDSDSTFVRMEDMCPTTSSMSNLVDAMACSSPHEKLIVDLRDSLFMLLHGRNEKKEMAIGSLQEREQTAAQILFWVANLALHSFDEMENPLSSLTNLSPHIVLFSEHMVICIVMHSDFSSSDSDSSSISSTTVVTSASDDDDDDDDSLPSSAFEDEDDFKKECLRWKAPELLVNKKMGATKESVAFSIGMMVWECLTLEVPFGEYGAEVAGQKIVNGEKPDVRRVCGSSLAGVVKGCLSQDWGQRPSVNELKREFIVRFPKGAAIMTMTDAICVREESMAGLNRSMMSESEE
ncbi:uncharacterized protein MONOS_14095 [Monocercomonoides exilis]|uniref:uncharacterized protein n=1 Tax=Monocercomonoides exilis TaxID=2049356 RepID=UPI003559B9C0|nr:hypothetical protein MONOS_14095 [Monocercomonoides exilis]|eukprot:MONOS_14095.1-p1 / transcript=MONOS_14095.1 / gene=MONOS_14095 / organism=Monocercomonoides_exilis_PA203 / gene_product=unspecified product / transcript_product=unspecified product / location=Mono_scaffold00936:6520-18373(-) / protein_length=3920 / sequence_SO=supercontig / SO=protein_coding / is_pseudo=false